MKNLIYIIIPLLILSCSEESNNEASNKDSVSNDMEKKQDTVQNNTDTVKVSDLEVMAHEGVSVDFIFKGNKPTFGELFLICGYENPNFPPKHREFEKVADLGFEQSDDYFAIKNKTDIGDDIILWLFPLFNGEEVYHHDGEIEGIRITYVVLRNQPKNAKLFEKVFYSFISKLDVEVKFNKEEISDFSIVNEQIIKVVDFCEHELKVVPGSEEALALEW